ncbi:hypothetical protein K435DRAFT_853510 [Dendrothele bispora CBS 962.96]|uniref:Uncharacterized protein n=1 Tax=Dendrothele bispora (strain CBS 962.96) TaxID=1314807 RepID=A0A4S8MGM5_DENBC|nr:hypothetical protein K435DRAFT_853510 [Dendrothele bispora CBS 962.96]
MEEGWVNAPRELKHLHQSRKTIDGNFQANRYRAQRAIITSHEPRFVPSPGPS